MIDDKLAPYGATVLRVSLGVMFIAHALLKYWAFTIPGFAGFLGSVGFPAFMAWPVFLLELIGGVMLVLGFYGRLASVALLPVLLGALVVHIGNGWLFSAPNGGWEYPAFLITASIAHIAIGDGAWALRPAGLPFVGRPARA